MSMPAPKQWEPLAIVPILSGFYWLFAASGGDWLFWGLLPGTLMLATGVGLLLWPGDLRLTEFMAGGAMLGLAVILPVLLEAGIGQGLAAAVLAIATFVMSGWVALQLEPSAEGVPPPDPTVSVAAKAALDEALLAYFVGSADLPSGARALAICERAGPMERAVTELGWADKPELLHVAPPAPDRVYSQQARLYGHS
jgi:hypothetical protein